MSPSKPDAIKRHFIKLFGHLEWADKLVLESLRSARNLKSRDLELYSHIVGVEHTWLCRINEVDPRIAVWPKLTLQDSERLAKENAAAFNTLIEGMATEKLQSPITYRNSAGNQFTSTVEEILTQVALHGAYHRGQIAASVRANGDIPAPTDYIAFVRGSPAATRQPKD